MVVQRVRTVGILRQGDEVTQQGGGSGRVGLRLCLHHITHAPPCATFRAMLSSRPLPSPLKAPFSACATPSTSPPSLPSPPPIRPLPQPSPHPSLPLPFHPLRAPFWACAPALRDSASFSHDASPPTACCCSATAWECGSSGRLAGRSGGHLGAPCSSS